jgi:hypothetical protein
VHDVPPTVAVGDAARLPPESVIDVDVCEAVPPQVVVVGPLTVRPVGRLSVRLRPESVIAR